MAGTVFFSVTMSLDGYIAPVSSRADVEALRRGEFTPNLRRWMERWSELQSWVFGQRFFRESLNLGEGGEEGLDNASPAVPISVGTAPEICRVRSL